MRPARHLYRVSRLSYPLRNEHLEKIISLSKKYPLSTRDLHGSSFLLPSSSYPFIICNDSARYLCTECASTCIFSTNLGTRKKEERKDVSILSGNLQTWHPYRIAKLFNNRASVMLGVERKPRKKCTKSGVLSHG